MRPAEPWRCVFLSSVVIIPLSSSIPYSILSLQLLAASLGRACPKGQFYSSLSTSPKYAAGQIMGQSTWFSLPLSSLCHLEQVCIPLRTAVFWSVDQRDGLGSPKVSYTQTSQPICIWGWIILCWWWWGFLCLRGGLVTSLASNTVPSTWDNPRCLQTLPDAPSGELLPFTMTPRNSLSPCSVVLVAYHLWIHVDRCL